MPDPLISLGVFIVISGLAALLFWPERGLFQRWQQAHRMTERVLIEDALKHLHNCEVNGRRPTLASAAGSLHITVNEAAQLLHIMESSGLLILQDGAFRLTAKGRDSALHIIRAHRLWERYLADQTGFEEAEWHDLAERYEHTLLPAEVDALSTRLGNPTYDPHGDPIPDASGDYVTPESQPLIGLDLDTPARIVHIEDEPAVVYAQILAEGLYPGMVVRLSEISPHRVRFWANGDEHVLAPIVAANISTAPLPKEAPEAPLAGEPLSGLLLGQRGKVLAVSPGVRGPERRRLMDLGILPGTVVTAEMTSPGGDPTAYRIRDTLIALREEQAQWIRINPVLEPAS